MHYKSQNFGGRMRDKDFELIQPHLGGISRRDFMKFCLVSAASMGLPLGMAPKIAEAIASPQRPPVIWLQFQECTGCTEGLLRTNHPSIESLILDLISLDYHETVLAPSGHGAEEDMERCIKDHKGKFVLVVEGATPVKDNGIYCKIGGKTALQILKDTAPHAAAIIAIGSCASWGGVPSAAPNPTGATPVHKIIKDKPVVNIPGCPPNGYNFLNTVIYFLTFKKLPELDSKGRPKFAYGRLIHENCERRPHFDAGRFAREFGDEGHRLGYCLYELGCKGPETYNNCSIQLFGDVGSAGWPVGTGCPCFGCSEEGVGFAAPLFSQASLHLVTPPDTYPPIHDRQGHGASTGTVAVLAGAAGVAIGAGAVTAMKLGKLEESESGKESGKE
jgi:hydrogenase small subunit